MILYCRMDTTDCETQSSEALELSPEMGYESGLDGRWFKWDEARELAPGVTAAPYILRPS